MSKSRIVQRDLRWPMLAAGLLAFTALLYSPLAGFPFLQLDDNPRLLQQDLSQTGLTWAFNNAFAWQPVTWLSHQLDFRLFGFQNASRHHLVNLALHLANIGLFFWFLVKLTGQRAPSLVAAALFALHPLRVEAVAWVSARGELLATFFVLLALEAHRRQRWWAVILLGALAMMASPAAAPFAVVLFLIDRWLLNRPANWRETAPLLALGAVALVLRATGGPDHETLLKTAPSWSLTQALATLDGQAWATFWPINLSIARAPDANLMATGFGVAIGAILAVIIWFGRLPIVRFAAAWFLFLLLPSLILPTVWGRTDSASYLPHLGLITALVFAIPGPWRSMAGQLVVLPLLACAALSWAHLHRFQGTVPLLQHAVDLNATNAEARLALGYALSGQGTPAAAEKHLQYVTQARPDSALAWVGYGRALTSLKRAPESLAVLETAVKRVPQSADARFEYGIALQNMKRVPEAEQSFIQALNLGLDARTGAIAYNNLGSYAAQRQEFAQAEKYFEQAFTLDLGFALAHRNYAMTLVAQKQRAKAINHLETKATLWTNNNRLVGEYLASLMNEVYAETYRKQQEEMAREQAAEKKAIEQRKPK